jgi:NAD(P)H-dependent FMN reductase
LSKTVKILAFAGSARRESLNRKLIAIAAGGAAKAGAQVTTIDLGDFELPLYDGDLEDAEGLPENAAKLKNLMADHDGLLIASPEYNSSISPLLKNTIDWATRPGSPDEPSLMAFAGKVAGLMSASPGGLGGLRGLVHLRSILGNIRVLVLPDQRAVSGAHSAFADDGTMKDEKLQHAIEAIGAEVVRTCGRLQD